ncbi:sensor histidine kinase [Mahella australiensis]|uniref:histidine kinase n=1 Tax=Mahella australiensis (strain DSM 15567 / CIP 107919 / 50-1 BON) TaxID=697281 RepID=F3ZZ48_MAHA5|nr:sensor histidine kinase [Mahella australiensis]AEE97830.1 integral membrane sensor signal transduction histidine kinase [Mahella australiensis 50-1 BON]
MLKIPHIKYRQKLAIAILLFTVIPYTVFCAIYLSGLWNTRADEIVVDSYERLKEAADNADRALISVAQKANYISSNYQIYEFLSNDPGNNDLASVLTAYQNMRSIFDALRADNYGSKFTIYVLRDFIYGSDYIVGAERMEGDAKSRILKADGDALLWEHKDDYIILYKKIMSINTPLAIIEVKMPFEKITEQFQYDIPEGSFIVYSAPDDSHRTVVGRNGISSDEAFRIADAYFADGAAEDFYTIAAEVGQNVGSARIFIPKAFVYGQIRGPLIITIAIFLALAFIIFFLVEIVAKALTRRMSVLIYEMDKNLDETLSDDAAVSFEGDDEFGEIWSRFYSLLQKVKGYYKEIIRYEAEKKQLELDVLQSSINPHFLYNTLAAVKWTYPDQRLAYLIDSMVRYYRIALNKGNNILKVSQEIDMIRQYLELQKFAYDSNFTFSIDVEETILDCLILKQLLQPIVENAVLHGVNGLEGGGAIRITGELVGRDIIFEISDNGPGIEPERIEDILNGTNLNTYSGYGISNVQKRTKLYYGEEYGISIKSTVNKGTTVTVIIPSVYS